MKTGERIMLQSPKGERGWIEAQIGQHRHTNPPGGVDHGSKGVVIAETRIGNGVHRRLVWFTGHYQTLSGVRGFGRSYSPAHLEVINGNGYSVATIVREGRLSTTMLQRHADAIDEAMETEVTWILDHRRTFVLVREGQPS